MADPVSAVEITKDHLGELVHRYTDSDLHSYHLIDCTRDDGKDIRLIFIVEFVYGGKVVVNLTSLQKLGLQGAYSNRSRTDARLGNLTHEGYQF